jgi:PAS domain S-box-containing protein
VNERAKADIEFPSEQAIDLLRDAPCGIAVTSADGRLLFVNETLARWAGRAVSECVGVLSLRHLLTRSGQLYHETHIAPMMRIQGFVREISCHIDSVGRNPMPVLLSGVARRDDQGHVRRIDYTIFDARERYSYEEALRSARAEAEELAAIVRASPDAILRIDSNGIVKNWNVAAVGLLGRSVDQAIGASASDAIPIPDLAEWLSAKVGEQIEHDSREAVHADGRDFDITLVRIGAFHPTVPADYTLILRDISLRKQVERHRETALQEMNHRIKNTFAVISAIARQTLSREAASGFIGRLRLLSQAHDALAAARTGTIDLKQLLDFAAIQAGGSARLSFDGPPVELPPRHATSLSMVFHELLTNALKYGALCSPEGHVRVDYMFVDGVLSLDWIESGGPPVSDPSREGFGTRMIKMLLTSDEGAEAQFDFRPEGLKVSARLPLGNR